MITIVLVSLACSGHGRRAQLSSQPSNALSSLLLASDPEAAFRPYRGLAGPSASHFKLAHRSSRALKMEAGKGEQEDMLAAFKQAQAERPPDEAESPQSQKLDMYDTEEEEGDPEALQRFKDQRGEEYAKTRYSRRGITKRDFLRNPKYFWSGVWEKEQLIAEREDLMEDDTEVATLENDGDFNEDYGLFNFYFIGPAAFILFFVWAFQGDGWEREEIERARADGKYELYNCLKNNYEGKSLCRMRSWLGQIK